MENSTTKNEDKDYKTHDQLQLFDESFQLLKENEFPNLSSVTEMFDLSDDVKPESEKSDLDTSPVLISEEKELSDEGNVASDKPKRKAKTRSSNDPTKRRKIRKFLTGEKLNAETLEALKQEEDRRKRLEEQALHAAQKKLEVAKIIQQQESLEGSNSSFAASRELDQSCFAGSFLTNLLTSGGIKSFPPVTVQNIFPTKKSVARPSQAAGQIICISSDSEEEENVTNNKEDTIDVCSDSSDDVICTGEVVDEEPEPVDVNNSGMHIEDAKNHRDDQGRVLVNVNRPNVEPEVFLAPQLAAAVLPHQIGGIRFMFDNIVETLSQYETSVGFGCILAHSMGLGKTLQVISFIDVFLRYTKARTVLCVVPVNTLLNWVSEFNMWLPPKSKCLDKNPAQVWPRSFPVHLLTDVHKTTESRSKVVKQWYEEGGVLLLGYEMYRLLASRKHRRKRIRKKSSKQKESCEVDLVDEDRLESLSIGMQASLLKPGPDLIICDEGHRIKNDHASISQMLKNVRTRRRIVLTGYPLQNNLMEYWCMVDFVRPNFLGTKQEFSNMFERPILNGQCTDSTEADVRLMRFRSHVLHSLLKGFVQRRSHSVLREALPFKEEHVFMIRLSEWQKKLYNSFIERKMYSGSGSWGSTANPIRAFSVCCKIWNHPDVLHRAVQKDEEANNDLDPDFDIIEPLDGAPTPAKPRLPPKANSHQELYSAAATLLGGRPHSSNLISCNGSSRGPPSVPTIQTNTGFNPFGDDRDKRLQYEWAKNLLAGYSTGLVELSGKMLILMQLIHSSVTIGDRMLVFSQSLSTLTLIEEFLSERFLPRQNSEQPARKWCRNQSYFRLDGSTNSADREKMINMFNSPSNRDVHLFLLSTRAGCLGINLIGANRVVVLDASWNPCHDAQAVCRVYRYGQKKTCHIYRLICDQTMEKKIYERQVSKQGMSDRVVDKLNPSQMFTKQDVLSLMEFSHHELPKVDFRDLKTNHSDPVLIGVCKTLGHWLTKKPFTHESLLLDCKDQRLTKAEKRAAEKSYEREKLASSTYSYGRQSYAGFHPSSHLSNVRPATSTSFNPLISSQSRDLRRPIANVRPMQSTPLPLSLQTDIPAANPSTPYLHKSGISVQKVTATMDIPLPPQTTISTTMAVGQPTKINAGDAICIVRSKKGTYIRTSQGRTFAVRLNDSLPHVSGAQNEPTTRLVGSISAPLLSQQAPVEDKGSALETKLSPLSRSTSQKNATDLFKSTTTCTNVACSPSTAPKPANCVGQSITPWVDKATTSDTNQSTIATSSESTTSFLLISEHLENNSSCGTNHSGPSNPTRYTPATQQSPNTHSNEPSKAPSSNQHSSMTDSNSASKQFSLDSNSGGISAANSISSTSCGSLNLNSTANDIHPTNRINSYQTLPTFSTNQNNLTNNQSLSSYSPSDPVSKSPDPQLLIPTIDLTEHDEPDIDLDNQNDATRIDDHILGLKF